MNSSMVVGFFSVAVIFPMVATPSPKINLNKSHHLNILIL